MCETALEMCVKERALPSCAMEWHEYIGNARSCSAAAVRQAAPTVLSLRKQGLLLSTYTLCR